MEFYKESARFESFGFKSGALGAEGYCRFPFGSLGRASGCALARTAGVLHSLKQSRRSAHCAPPTLAQREGFAPLAARLGEQRTVLFSLRNKKICLKANQCKPIAPAIASTLESLSKTVKPKNGGGAFAPPPFLAQREGFEPPEAFTSTVFKTAAFDRSAISAFFAAYCLGLTRLSKLTIAIPSPAAPYKTAAFVVSLA